MTLPTNYQPWIFGFSIIQFIWSAWISYTVRRSDKEKVTTDRFQKQEERITKIETDIQLGNVATGADLKLGNERHLAIVKRLEEIGAEVTRHADCKYHQGFEKRLDQMNGSIKKVEGVIEGRMEGIGSALDMIQQHLLSGGK